MSEEKHTPQEAPHRTGKPVFVYIIILFMAAFLLMGLSFLTHQRSNTEALGQLQDSVTAMQQIQNSQEKIIELQEELAQAEEEKDQLQQQHQQELDTIQQQSEKQKKQLSAVTNLYCLQQAYSAANYELCKQLIQDMEDFGLDAFLPSSPLSGGDVTAPSIRYLQLREAVEQRLTEMPAP